LRRHASPWSRKQRHSDNRQVEPDETFAAAGEQRKKAREDDTGLFHESL